MNILALNAGSSSLKFRIAGMDAAVIFEGSAAGLGKPDAGLKIKNAAGEAIHEEPCADLHNAAQIVLRFAQDHTDQLSAIGHRIVHGGPHILAHCVIDGGVRAALDRASTLAPLHNPPALDVLDLAQAAFSGVPQIACLDTVFHARLPAVAARFPLPADQLGEGIRRYGFHGLSCESILAQLDPVPARLIIAHLGGGASVTAVKDGRSVDTSMGLTPDGGVIMETRSGDLDPGLLIYLLRQGQTADSLEQLLSRKSGIAGVSGTSGDPREARQDTGENGRLALEMFATSVAKSIAGMATVLGGIDQLIFTGGIGEHDGDLRQCILGKLAWIGTVPVGLLPAQEEAMIVNHCVKLASLSR